MKQACLECGQPTDRTRCTTCKPPHRRDTTSRQQRGYGRDHEKLARRLTRLQPWCSYCHQNADQIKQRGDRLTLDHVTPLSHGGQTTLDNCVVACGRCNTSKHNRRTAHPNRAASHHTP